MKRARTFLAVAACAMTLVGCGTSPPTVAPTPGLSDAPVELPTNEIAFEIRCTADGGSLLRFESLQDVWDDPVSYDSCFGVTLNPGANFSFEQTYAFSQAGFDYRFPLRLGIIVGVCAEVASPALTVAPEQLTSEEFGAMSGATKLCPEAPQADFIKAQVLARNLLVQQSAQEQIEQGAAEDAGIRDGVWEVGTQIAPGTFVHEGPVENCYWSRLDDTGGIISNEFILAATRISVTVLESDFSLYVDGCGVLLPE